MPPIRAPGQRKRAQGFAGSPSLGFTLVKGGEPGREVQRPGRAEPMGITHVLRDRDASGQPEGNEGATTEEHPPIGGATQARSR
jgi:hypothetical protein